MEVRQIGPDTFEVRETLRWSDGTPVKSTANITITDLIAGGAATIYSDRHLQTAISNLSSNKSGDFSFFVPAGKYRIAGPAGTKAFEDLDLQNPFAVKVAGLDAAVLFGDGSDGAALFDGVNPVTGTTRVGTVYTLTRDVFYTTMLVDVGVSVVWGGWRIFASVSIINNGIIRANGNAGTNAGNGGNASGSNGGAGGAAGAAGAALASNSVAGGRAGQSGSVGVFGGTGSTGGAGGAGGNAPGVAGGAAGANEPVALVSGVAGTSGGAGGDGGNAGVNSGGGSGAGAPGSAAGTKQSDGSIRHHPLNVLLQQFFSAVLRQIFAAPQNGQSGAGRGGAGGANTAATNVGGGGGGSGGSGGGGSNGGVGVLVSPLITNNGVISANGGAGGNGGNGGNGAAATSTAEAAGGGGGGGGGGGTGGNGGLVVTISRTYAGAAPVANAGTGGTAGLGGTFGLGVGGGANGVAGTNGSNGNNGSAGLVLQFTV